MGDEKVLELMKRQIFFFVLIQSIGIISVLGFLLHANDYDANTIFLSLVGSGCVVVFLAVGLATIIPRFPKARECFKDLMARRNAKLPSDLLQEEFDQKYPFYSPKLPPSTPVLPEQKDNPYRYE